MFTLAVLQTIAALQTALEYVSILFKCTVLSMQIIETLTVL
jgi:hypothetical protein